MQTFIRNFLQKNILCVFLYNFFRIDFIKEKIYSHQIKHGKILFDNRQVGQKKLLYILAGYKDFCNEVVFQRVEAFTPSDIDICVVCSGKNKTSLRKLCLEKKWSYLSTGINNIAYAQNLVIQFHPNALYIFKMDEDIFLTKDTIDILYKTFHTTKECNIGFAMPLIPINAFGYPYFLKKYQLLDIYSQKYDNPILGTYHTQEICNNPETAVFLWNNLPQIDNLNLDCQQNQQPYSFSPIKVNIGFILFKREIWEQMGQFRLPTINERRTNPVGMALDENQLCSFCFLQYKAILIAQKCAVGHLGFSKQSKIMKHWFLQNLDKFKIKK